MGQPGQVAHTWWQLTTKVIVSDIEFVETGEQPQFGRELSRQVVAAEMQMEEVGEIAQRLSCLKDNTRELIVVQAQKRQGCQVCNGQWEGPVESVGGEIHAF